MRVEVDLYSGRPNPSFELGVEQGEELRRRLRRLPRHPDPPLLPTALGYRGLLVDDASRMGRITLCRGAVLVEEPGGGRRWLHDPGGDVERWLVAAGAPALDPGTAAFLRDQTRPSDQG